METFKGIPVVKPVELLTVELKNVLIKKTRTSENLSVQVVPFDRYDDSHVEFAYAYSDMLYRAPSKFKTVDDASRGYVQTFLARKEEDLTNEDSTFNKVLHDTRACRTLFNSEVVMIALTDFFENA
jgi:hypothetical protein